MNQDVVWDHFQNEGVDSFRHSSPRMEFLARQFSPGERVLNVGVGTAELERLGIKRGAEMWSLDPSKRAIEGVRHRLGLGDRAKVGYSQDMPFEAESFDAVVMSEVLEHLTLEVFGDTLKEVRRVLRPGGRLMGTVPAREKLSDSIVVCPSCQHRFHRWGHERSFDVESLKSELSAQFAVERMEEHFFIPWQTAGWRQRIQGLLKKVLSARNIGAYATNRNIFFVARKERDT